MAFKIVQCGYMSGDTYAAAAMLAADPSCRILLVKDSKGSGPYADKSGLILKIYAESGVDKQVKVFDISAERFDIRDFWGAVKDGFHKKQALPARSTDRRVPTPPLIELLCKMCLDERPGGWPRGISFVTEHLSNLWAADPVRTQNAVARAWRVGKLPAEVKFKLYEFMATAFSKLELDIRTNIVVLWSRQSGKRGGAHLELDSSFAGIRQIARALAVDKRATILLSGDESARYKLADLAAEDLHIVNVSNMWDHDLWQTPSFKQVKFLTQFAFYKYLSDDYRVIHLGMRSGMLESMALLGMEVFYLEDVGSGSGDRMIKFERNGITYRRIQFTESPGLTGRIQQLQSKLPGTVIQEKIAALADRNKGRKGFAVNFSGPDIRQADTDWAAKVYAKASLLGTPLDDRDFDAPTRWNDLTGMVNAERGFAPGDLAHIVTLVQGQYR